VYGIVVMVGEEEDGEKVAPPVSVVMTVVAVVVIADVVDVVVVVDEEPEFANALMLGLSEPIRIKSAGVNESEEHGFVGTRRNMSMGLLKRVGVAEMQNLPVKSAMPTTV
jgi:hypothetical protein